MWIETCLFFLVLLLWLFLKGGPHNFPPGPWGLPLVGYMPFLTKNPPRKCFELAKKYGEVMGFTLGSFNCVVLNSESSIREAMKEIAFAGRPLLPITKERSGGKKKGVLLGEGEEWHEQRRFVLRTLRDFGFGKRSMEETIQEEVKELVSWLRMTLNTPIELSMRFNIAVVNSLWAMVAGERMPHDDPKIHGMVNSLVTSVQENPLTGPQLFMPWLVEYFPRLMNSLSSHSTSLTSLAKMIPFLKNVIDEHRHSYDSNYERDLVDMYLKEINACNDPKSSFHGSESLLTLRTVLLDLFVAGTETTSTTLRWAILHLVRNPSVQTKVQTEIHRVVGHSRPPALQDRPNLPYTDATIFEVQRIASILPFSVFHSTTEDTVFRGYNIPKDTVVFPNLYAVLHDPNHWKDPEEFRPERFLSEDGTVKRDPYFIPFSIGKRACLGETLARESLFLFFSSLVQNFSFFTEPGKDAPDPDDAYVGVVTVPKQFKVVVRETDIS